jgi:transposase
MASARVEVITRAERRRRWSPADKLRLVMMTREPGATVASVAREHGVSESLLYAWRGRLMSGAVGGPPVATVAGGFVPIAVVGDRPVSSVGPGAGCGPVPAATIEIELPNGCRLRVHERIATSMLRKVIAVLGGIRPGC